MQSREMSKVTLQQRIVRMRTMYKVFIDMLQCAYDFTGLLYIEQ